MTNPQVVRPQTQRVYLTGDVEYGDGAGKEDPQAGAPAAENLLTIEEAEAARLMLKLWTDLDELGVVQRRQAEWEANRLRRKGMYPVRVVKKEGLASYEAIVPRGGNAVEGPNKARTLCRIYTGNMFVDPPAPDVTPSDGGDDDRDVAEAATRILLDLQSTDRLNTPQVLRKAFDLAHTYDTGYVWYDVVGQAKRVPKSIRADQHPQATAEQPLIDGASITDRYVAEDGVTLTDDAGQAQLVWSRDLRSEALTGKHVRAIPYTAKVAEAEGVMKACFLPWRQVIRLFPDLAQLDDKDKEALASFRPTGADQLMPKGLRKQNLTGENALVFCLWVVYRECPEYEDGFYGVSVGGKRAPERRTWVGTVDGKREALPLPVADVWGFENGEDEPTAYMSELGGLSEQRAAQLAHYNRYLDRFNNLPIFLPTNSIIQPEQMRNPPPVMAMNPGGKPEVADIGKYPDPSLNLFTVLGQEMNEAGHLSELAQGLDSPNIESGVQALRTVEQAHANLAEPKQNIERAYVRCCRIEMALARAFAIDGEARTVGEDGAYKVEKWRGADLTGDVQLKKGTLTMLTPAGKAGLATMFQQAGILPPDEYRDIIANNVGPLVALQDDPFRLEIRRSLAEWQKGPPEGWAPPMAPVDPVTGQPMMQPVAGPPDAMGMPTMGGMQPVPPPPDPQAAILFPPSPHHSLPGVAQIRVTALARTMATKKYQQQHPDWRALVEQQFTLAQQMAAGPPPPPTSPSNGESGQVKPPPGGGPPVGGIPPRDDPAGQSLAA